LETIQPSGSEHAAAWLLQQHLPGTAELLEILGLCGPALGINADVALY
jgi:hypothetical protein